MSRRYTSKHNATIVASQPTRRTSMVFGPAPGTQKPQPKNYTTKGRGETIRRQSMEAKPRGSGEQAVAQTVLVPPTEPRSSKEVRDYVPKATHKATLAPRTSKDFVRANRRESLEQAKGTRRLSTEAQPLTKSKGYGKVPKYLTARKEAEAVARDELQHTLAAQAVAASPVRRMTDEERAEILAGLKSNREELHKEYLGLSMVVDSMPKRIRKNAMEAQLAELEADISKIERHESIYVEVGRQ